MTAAWPFLYWGVKRGTGRNSRTAGAFERTEIVLIDQQPLRRRVAGDCADLMERLEVVRVAWHQFDREDKPAFVRWRAREFGALLSKAREVEIQLRDSQTLVHEVEMEMRRRIQDPFTAYQRVMFRRENPAVAEEEQETRDAPGSEGSAQKISDFEKETLFQEWVQKFLGTNPDKMDDEAYTTTFEVFKAHMFKPGREETPSGSLPRQQPRPKKPSAAVNEEEQAQEEASTVDARVKSLYRKLVRRLHPDHRSDGDAAVSSLWHEVQEAYAAADVARMEILLALSDIQADALGEQTTLAQMRNLRSELERSLSALEKSVEEAEGEECWNFARSGPSEDLRVRVERQLKHELAGRMDRLDLLTATIADWARGPVKNPKVRAVRHFSAGR
jgi:hypothetical protein